MMNQEEYQQENIASRHAKQLLRQKAMKLGKKAAVAAAKIAIKATIAVTKFILTLLAGLGLPYILIIIGIIIGVIVLFLIVTMLFNFAPDALNDNERALYEHVVAVSNSTVDMSKPEQIPYKVPHELILAAMQIYESSSTVTPEEAATQIGQALKPIFQYETYQISTDYETTSCIASEEGTECSTGTSTIVKDVVVLVGVESWDRIVNVDVTTDVGEWVSSTSTYTNPDGNEVEIISKSKDTSISTNEIVNTDYSLFDRTLSESPFDYGETSKLTVEAIYQITGGEIYYKEWLTNDSVIGFNGSIIPGAGVPTEYMQIYLEAEKKYKVDWYYIAAIHYIETKFSTHEPMISSVGAEGHMQFMPCTWLGWNYSGCKGGKGGVSIPDTTKHSPSEIRKHGGYGVDANGDGKANPWDIHDAIHTAANYLNKSGFTANIDKAIRAYNHSDKYVNDVKNKAMELKMQAQYIPTEGSIPNLVPGSFMRPTTAAVGSKYGPRNIRGYSRNFHYGLDFPGAVGTPIVAVADGVVVKGQTTCSKNGYIGSICNGVGWGNYMKIRHEVQGQTYEAIYAHMHNVYVRPGQVVKQGQQIGTLGNSGSSSGPHLHFEIHRGSAVYQGMKALNSLNPAHYLPL